MTTIDLGLFTLHTHGGPLALAAFLVGVILWLAAYVALLRYEWRLGSADQATADAARDEQDEQDEQAAA